MYSVHLVKSHQTGIHHQHISLRNRGEEKKNAINLNSIFNLPVIPVNELIYDCVNVR